LHPLCNQSFSFWERLRNFLNWAIEEYVFQFETLSENWVSSYLIIREKELQAFHKFSVAACFGKPVARRSKILVPRFREAGDNLLRGLPRDVHACMDNVTPGVHPGAFFHMLFETDPLRQHYSERVVDPTHLVRRLTIRYDVTHNRLHWLQNFDFQPASRFPRPSFAPVQLAINVCKFIPSPPIRENLPGQIPAGLRVHTILKSKHILLFRAPSFRNFRDPNEASFGPIVYTLYL
jgi:hypothetical protein